ncbi:MAG TPA: hypothetical protein VGS11_10475 [Candidatus Bathyarchaeia archaeon]|nr:hypothetical protein [Candidatus Bathyarchaeia archaeon]
MRKVHIRTEKTYEISNPRISVRGLAGEFELNDIARLSITYTFPNSISKSEFDEFIDTVKAADFKGTKFDELDILNILSEILPRLTLKKEFTELNVKSKSIELVIAPVTGRTRRKENNESSKAFSAENLEALEPDLNLVLGLLIGRFALKSETLQVSFQIDASKRVNFVHELTPLLKEDSMAQLGAISDWHLNAVELQFSESILGRKVKGKYLISHDETSVSASATSSFPFGGRFDIAASMRALLDRLNEVVKVMAGGLNG